MKLILTGATGFIGGEILRQCLTHQYVHHVFVLTRRPLSDELASHKKVTQIIVADFAKIPDDVIRVLKAGGAAACIWAIGGKVQQFKTADEARTVGIAYPTAAAEALAAHIASAVAPWKGYPTSARPFGAQPFPFRFVFISAWGAEQDQFRSLWIGAEDRKIKGAAEKGLFEIATQSAEVDGHRCFETIALRPGGVLSPGETLVNLIGPAVTSCVTVDRLARRAIAVALDGAKGQLVLENRDCLGDDWAMGNSLVI